MTTKCYCIPFSCMTLPQEIDSQLEDTVLSPLLIRNPQLIARDTVAVERTTRRKEEKEGKETEDGSGNHVCTSLSKNAHTKIVGVVLRRRRRERERIDISRLRGTRSLE